MLEDHKLGLVQEASMIVVELAKVNEIFVIN